MFNIFKIIILAVFNPSFQQAIATIAQAQCQNITAVVILFCIQGYSQAWPHASSYVGIISESCRSYIRLVGVLSQIDPSC